MCPFRPPAKHFTALNHTFHRPTDYECFLWVSDLFQEMQEIAVFSELQVTVVTMSDFIGACSKY